MFHRVAFLGCVHLYLMWPVFWGLHRHLTRSNLFLVAVYSIITKVLQRRTGQSWSIIPSPRYSVLLIASLMTRGTIDCTDVLYREPHHLHLSLVVINPIGSLFHVFISLPWHLLARLFAFCLRCSGVPSFFCAADVYTRLHICRSLSQHVYTFLLKL